MLKLKDNCGAIEIKALGIRLTHGSSPEEIESALKARPELSVYIDGAKPQKDVKK